MLQKIKMQHFFVVTAVMAVVLQIQITLFEDGDYRGLRIGLGDLFLPFLGVFVLLSLLFNKTQWPEWLSTRKIFWICSLVLVMSASLLNGYIVQGQLSHWALVNKYIGFFALLSYFILGNWVATNVANQQNIYSVFMRYFVGFFIAVVVLSMLTLLMQPFFGFSLWLPEFRWDGFAANRNAFALLFIFAFCCLAFGVDVGKKPIVYERMLFVFLTMLPVFFVFNASRAGWLLASILIVFLCVRSSIANVVKYLLFLMVGVALVFVSSSFVTSGNSKAFDGKQVQRLMDLSKNRDDVSYHGDQNRYIAIEDGLEMYAQYNPLVGAGLGSYQPFQIAKRGEFIEVIDFTALLLLVETGAVGLVVFTAFFFYCAWLLYCYGYRQKEPSYYHRAMFVFLLSFAAMSVLHEIMYTRVLWFAMGLALVTPKVKEA